MTHNDKSIKKIQLVYRFDNHLLRVTYFRPENCTQILQYSSK